MGEAADGRRVAPSDRRGELLARVRDEVATRRPSDLLTQWTNDAAVSPSPVDQRLTAAVDLRALQAATEYESVLLSPVAPAGTNSVVAPTSQDRTATTIRGTEVVSDPTNVLALESARRLRSQPDQRVRLCTVHQVLRMQPVIPGAGHTRHFRLLALADAGPGLADDGFEVDAVVAQLTVYRRVLDRVTQAYGWHWDRPITTVRTDGRLPALAERLTAALVASQRDMEIRHERLESNYYHGLRVGMSVRGADGVDRDWIDLGVFDWVAQLTSNRRHRFVASALGLQLLALQL